MYRRRRRYTIIVKGSSTAYIAENSPIVVIPVGPYRVARHSCSQDVCRWAASIETSVRTIVRRSQVTWIVSTECGRTKSTLCLPTDSLIELVNWINPSAAATSRCRLSDSGGTITPASCRSEELVVNSDIQRL